MIRPAVDIVVPFAGPDAELEDLLRRLQAIELRSGDTLTVVDNRPGSSDRGEHVIADPEQQSSYHARNTGAARGRAPWLLFIDADVDPSPELTDNIDEAVELTVNALHNRVLDPGLPAPFRRDLPGWAPARRGLLGPEYAESPSELADETRPPFFDTGARYVGAFDPEGGDWTKGWTSFADR